MIIIPLPNSSTVLWFQIFLGDNFSLSQTTTIPIFLSNCTGQEHDEEYRLYDILFTRGRGRPLVNPRSDVVETISVLPF